MITDLLLGCVLDLLHLLVGTLPVTTVPAWMSPSGAVGSVFGAAGSMGAWFPVSLLLVVSTTVLAAWAAGFVVKLVRIVASFLTLGGGSAA